MTTTASLIKVCPLCSGDGYLEMGDRQRDGFGLEAWARTCLCSVSPREDYAEWQDTLRDAIAKGRLGVLQALVDECGVEEEEIVVTYWQRVS